MRKAALSESGSSGNVQRMLKELVNDGRAELASQGLARVTGHFATPEDEWQCTSGVGTDDAIHSRPTRTRRSVDGGPRQVIVAITGGAGGGLRHTGRAFRHTSSDLRP
ncbi:MAG: hypothetical protein QOI06_1512 [Nocardioidaceae bacterium]|nr:hypothetical protein [Nocardioidaceae bacterium]